MSTDSKEGFKPNPSQGDYWGGYMVTKWPYAFLVVLGGFFGLDKLALRSPSTAFLKFFVNVFFTGAWWVYDILQLFDTDFVAKYGHTTPFGVSGHGYRLIDKLTKDGTNEIGKPAPEYGGIFGLVLYILYCVTCWIASPFGVPSLIAGDYVGFFMKLLSLVFIITFPLYFITGVFDFFNAGDLEKEGVSRPWPVESTKALPLAALMPTLLYNDNREKVPAVNIISTKAKEEYEKSPQYKAFEQYQASNKSYLQGLINTTTSAASAYFTSTANMAAAAGDLAKGASAAISKNPEETASKYLGLGEKTSGSSKVPVLSSVPAAPEPLDTSTFEGVNPMYKAKQGGGGLIGISSELDKVLLLSMGVLIVGGFAAAALRKFSGPKREEEDEYPRKAYERDDPPPNPGGV